MSLYMVTGGHDGAESLTLIGSHSKQCANNAHAFHKCGFYLHSKFNISSLNMPPKHQPHISATSCSA